MRTRSGPFLAKYQYSTLSIRPATCVSMPASSRTSRIAAASVDSPLSTSPFGSCQRLLSPTEISATSRTLLRLRNATPPAEISSLVGIKGISLPCQRVTPGFLYLNNIPIDDSLAVDAEPQPLASGSPNHRRRNLQ